MAAFLGNVNRTQEGIWQIEVIVRCPFGRRPDKVYKAISDDDGNTFMDSSSGQSIMDASLVSRLRERIKNAPQSAKS